MPVLKSIQITESCFDWLTALAEMDRLTVGEWISEISKKEIDAANKKLTPPAMTVEEFKAHRDKLQNGGLFVHIETGGKYRVSPSLPLPPFKDSQKGWIYDVVEYYDQKLKTYHRSLEDFCQNFKPFIEKR